MLLYGSLVDAAVLVSDNPVTDLLQMLGRVSRPGLDEVRGVARLLIEEEECFL